MKKNLRRLGLATLTISLVVFFVVSFFNWQGKRRLQAVIDRIRSEGVELDAWVILDQKPAGSNLFDNPIFRDEWEWRHQPVLSYHSLTCPAISDDSIEVDQAILNFRQDIAPVLARLDRLQQSIQQADFFHYDIGWDEQMEYLEIEECEHGLGRMIAAMSQSATLYLHTKEPKAAFFALKSIDRFGKLVDGLLYLEVELKAQCYYSAQKIIREGLKRRAWTEVELVEILEMVRRWECSHLLRKRICMLMAHCLTFREEFRAMESRSEKRRLDPNNLKKTVTNFWNSEKPEMSLATINDHQLADYLEGLLLAMPLSERANFSEQWKKLEKVKRLDSDIVELIGGDKGLLNSYSFAEMQIEQTQVQLAIFLEIYYLRNGCYPKTVSSEEVGFSLKDISHPLGNDLLYTIGPNDRPVIKNDPPPDGEELVIWNYSSDSGP